MNKSKEFISKTLNGKKNLDGTILEGKFSMFIRMVCLPKTEATSLTRRKITSRTQLTTALSFSTKEISVKKNSFIVK